AILAIPSEGVCLVRRGTEGLVQGLASDAYVELHGLNVARRLRAGQWDCLRERTHVPRRPVAAVVETEWRPSNRDLLTEDLFLGINDTSRRRGVAVRRGRRRRRSGLDAATATATAATATSAAAATTAAAAA